MPRAAPLAPSATSQTRATWTFLSNHAHVLIVLSLTPDARIRDIADTVGITERAVQRIIAELTAGGFLTVTKVGRRNRYGVNERLHLRHPVEAHRTIRDLISLVR